jgi:hypothetical protein
MKGYYKNLHANKIQEINMSLYETISKKEMQAVLSVKKMSRSYYILRMNKLKILKPEVAKMLINSSFNEIELKGLKNIDDKSLNFLSQTPAALDLGITSLKVKQAKILLQNKASLTFSNLKTITVNVSNVLSLYQGNILEFPALTSIQPKAFAYLAAFKNEFLTIGSLTQKIIYKN